MIIDKNDYEPSFAELLDSAEISIENKGIIDQPRQINLPKDDSIKDQVDLHEKTRDQALEMVKSFLRSCQQAGKSPVRIITGKGEGILQQAAWQYLSTNPDKIISRFKHPGIREGGSGAVDVWLKKNV